MSRLVNWLENYILPIANRLAQIRWLVALRNAFMAMMPVTIAGSLAVLIKSLILAARDNLGWRAFAFFLHPLVAISDVVWRGTFSLFAVFLAVSLGYQLAKTFEVNRLAGGLVALASFMMSVASFTKINWHHHELLLKNAFDIAQFSTTGVFTAIVFGSLGFAVYLLGCQARLRLNIRSNLPPEEMDAFDSLIPGILAIFAVGALNYLFQIITGNYFGDWLLHAIQLPLMKMGQGFGMVLLVTVLIQIFWFLGINGGVVLAPILDSVWLTAENVNITAAKNGHLPKFIWVRGSFDAFAWFGGAGGTLMLIIAILIFSKRSDYRTIAKIALAPSVFNIGEPIIFGLPVVLNPIYFIPSILAPLVNVAFAYWMTVLGWVNPVQVVVPSIMPPIVNSFLACNYDWRAMILTLVNMALALLIWTPFVLAADRIADSNNSRTFFNPEY